MESVHRSIGPDAELPDGDIVVTGGSAAPLRRTKTNGQIDTQNGVGILDSRVEVQGLGEIRQRVRRRQGGER